MEEQQDEEEGKILNKAIVVHGKNIRTMDSQI